MRQLKFLSDLFLGGYITGLVYWSFNYHLNLISLALLLIAGISFFLTINFIISSIREHERRPALMSGIILGSLTLLLYFGAYIIT